MMGELLTLVGREIPLFQQPFEGHWTQRWSSDVRTALWGDGFCERLAVATVYCRF